MGQEDLQAKILEGRNQYYFERLKVVTQAGNFALKSAILINGGASVAMLAFIGHLFSISEGIVRAEQLSSSLVVFAIGTLVAAIASGATYVGEIYRSMSEFNKLLKQSFEQSKRWADRFAWTAIFLVVTAYVLFIGGVYCVYTAINC